MLELVLRVDRANADAAEKLKEIRVQEQMVAAARAAIGQPVASTAPATNNLDALIAEIRADKIRAGALCPRSVAGDTAGNENRPQGDFRF